MKRRTALKLIRYAKKATKAIAVVDGIGWMILVTLLDSEPPIGDIVMKYFILTMAILILDFNDYRAFLLCKLSKLG